MRHLAVFAAWILAAPAWAQQPAGGAWRVCLRRAVSRLEDRASDARTVAAAATAACRSVRFATLKAATGERDDLIERALEETRELDIDAATAIVLDQRRR